MTAGDLNIGSYLVSIGRRLHVLADSTGYPLQYEIDGHAVPNPAARRMLPLYLPFILLFVPMWAGLISSGAMYLWGHVLMLVAMAGAMAIRPDEYAHC